MRKIFATIVSAAAAAAVLSGCSSLCPNNSKADALKNSAWTLDINSLKGADSQWDKPAKDITLTFDENGKVAGCAGVNRYFSGKPALENDGDIDFGMMGSTMMAGPGLQYESLFLKTLDEADNFAIVDGKLYLYDDNNVIAVFTPGANEE
ncbi:MAG: META domain-containing protein [Victivallaceae bacterium]